MKFVTVLTHMDMTAQRIAWLQAGLMLCLLALPLLLAAPGANAQTPVSTVRVLVLVPTNIRGGPSITSSVIMQADVGVIYDVVGKTQDCAWLQIAANSPGNAASAWISGHPAYVELQGDCAAVSAAPTTTAVVSPTPSPINTAAQVFVIVRFDGAPLRSGAGVEYATISRAVDGAVLPAMGQVNNCAWIQVVTAAGEPGWISGNPAYSELQGACSQLTDATPPTPTPIPVPQVTVLLENTNIRTGGGISYRVARSAGAGERFVVLGQMAGCTWLQIADMEGPVGWISGNAAYVVLDQPCATLPVILPTPTPRPTATPQAIAPGCATIINQLGFAIRIDILRNDGWSDTISVSTNARRYYCINPGRYTITITSPTRNDSFSLPLVVRGGENFNIPLRMP